jgi:hypothetical protein
MNWFQRNFKSIIYGAFLSPILTVAFVSISHVTKWYGISNPISWSIYLSVGIEIAALSALAAISAKMGRKVYLPFGIVTLIQFIGNIFFAYQYIDVNGQTFKDWVDLVDPVVSYLGVESGDPIGHKRFLALFSGGMLPLISLSFLHMLIKFEEDDKTKITENIPEIDINKISIEAGKLEAEQEKEKYTPTEDDLTKLKYYLDSIQKDKFGEEQPELTDELEPEIEEPYYPTQEDEEELERLVDFQPEENPNVPKINRLSYLRRDG